MEFMSLEPLKVGDRLLDTEDGRFLTVTKISGITADGIETGGRIVYCDYEIDGQEAATTIMEPAALAPDPKPKIYIGRSGQRDRRYWVVH